MPASPAVTVIMYSYNHERYIADALEGVLAQKTSFPYEVIVHDDASTDGSASIIRQYEKTYPDTVKAIIQKDNQYSKPGVDIFLDYVLPNANGRYFAYCECDDYWIDENKLQREYDYLEANADCTAVYQNCVIVDENGAQDRALAYQKSCYRR